MAFVGDEISYKRWDMFQYYDVSVPYNSTTGINTFLTQSVLWQLQELRLHFSTAIGSVVYLKCKISSIINSTLNTILLSQSLNGVQDLVLYYSAPMLFHSGDILRITASSISVTNVVGIEAMGWAVRG
jgi:hypothetical protein